MPNRIIKESIRTSRSINSMTDFQFRLWVYLITYVDDYGRGSADPELLKGFVFPRRKRTSESDIEKALAELADAGCVHLYKVDGEPYLYLPNWSKHQRIQTKKGKYPAPEEADDYGSSQEPTVDHGGSRWVTVDHRESPPESESESNPNPNPNPNSIKGGKRPSKRKYGEFGHVQLTDEEYEKLKAYPAAEEYIAKVDRWCEQKGKKYKNYYLAILDWMERDGVKATAAASCPGPAPGSLAQEAVRRMMAESKEDDNAETVQGDREGGQH